MVHLVGNDGAIYIGNLKGELVAVSSNGEIRWRRSLDQRGSFISGSPAVDSNGNVYAVTTFRANVRDHRGGETVTSKIAHSRLHCLAPDGVLRWTYSFPESGEPYRTNGYSLSSPKILGRQNPLICIPASFTKIAPRIEILIIDATGALVHRTLVSDYPIPPVTTGNDVYDALNAIWEFLNGAEFEPRGAPQLNEQYGWPEPSLAVADFGPYAPEPVIVIDDNYKKLAAYRWSNRQLNLLWEKKANQVRLRATPAVFLSSMVASGQSDGTLALYDLLTGQELWKPWYKAPNPIQSPPVSFISQIYLLPFTQLIVLDANAKFWNRASLGMMGIGAPALSSDRIMVNGGDGYYTFSLDFKDMAKNGDFHGGVSSPAIGDDGTVYVMDRQQNLWAFGKESRNKPPRYTLS